MSISAVLRRKTIIATLLLATQQSALAVAPSAAQQVDLLEQLTEQGQMAQAYQLASQLEVSLAGEPRFDFYYGMAAMETGHVDEGVLALERVLLLNPGNQRVRLEFARALYLLGDNEAAEREFSRVLEAQPPEAVVLKVEDYLRRIKQRQSAYNPSGKIYVELGGGYDSNLNSAPEDQLDKVQLTEGSLGQGDGFYNLTLGGYAEFPLTEKHKLRLDSNLTGKRYANEDGFDNQVANLNGSWLIQASKADRLRTEVKAQNYQVDGDTFRNRYSVGVNWDHTFNPTMVAGASASFGRLLYPDDATSWRDADQINLGVHLYKSLPLWHRPMLFANSYLTDERPDIKTPVSNASANKRSLGLTLGFQLPLTPKQTIVLATSYQHSRYKGQDWLYGVRRDDRYRALSLSWKYSMTEQLTISSNLSLSNNSSSIELYSYDRDVISLNVKYEY